MKLSIATFSLGLVAPLVAAGYIPEPQPVKSCVEVTAIYYPGIDKMSEWDMIRQVYPDWEPLLGWYDEGNPENVDWQIKWAVEHGISSFCVDWYWCRGVQRFDHWVKAFQQARFRKYLKWYLHWCNHNDPGAHSREDQKAVTEFWIENYFKTPEYYKDETGRPLVVIYETWTNIERDFAEVLRKEGKEPLPGDGLKCALDISRELARKAGLPGIRFGCFVAQGRKDAEMAILEKAGIEELFQYVFAWPEMIDEVSGGEATAHVDRSASGDRWRYDYSLLSRLSRTWWTRNWNAKIPYWPPLSTGWDSTPRTFDWGGRIENRTPCDFRNICEDAKAFCQETGCRKVLLGPVNEWQEGSFIEPESRYGFSMYDAVRDVFCEKPPDGWPANLTPQSIGRPNPQLPDMERPDRTSWDFDDGVQGWYRNPYGAQTIRAHDGVLEFFRTFAGRSVASIRSRPKPFAADRFRALNVRMRLVAKPEGGKGLPTGNEKVRLMWGREGHPILAPSGRLDVSAFAETPAFVDGEWHWYELPLEGNPQWSSTIDELWFDPSDLANVNVEIDEMSFEKTPSGEMTK